MRNVFDQYHQNENRLTHALGIALNEDRKLLRLFLEKVAGIRPPCKSTELGVLVQQCPGEPELTDEEAERLGIPDLWIFNLKKSWCVVIESKVQLVLKADQIKGHLGTAKRRGFQTIIPMTIAVRTPTSVLPGCKVIEWRHIYEWLGGLPQYEWGQRLRRFMEVLENRMVQAEQWIGGTLTMFSGIPFSSPNDYSYLEAKRLLGMTTEELRKRKDLCDKLGMNPNGPGRPAITGQDSDRVWDFIPIVPSRAARNFTAFPHLTVGISRDHVEAMVTIPNSVNSQMRAKLVELGINGFSKLLGKILDNMKSVTKGGGQPLFRGVQRRYPSQKSNPFIDARIEFDLRTAFRSGPPKKQPAWLNAGYNAFVKKNNSNYQFQVGALIPFDRAPKLQSPQAISMIAEAWLACKPLIDLATARKQS